MGNWAWVRRYVGAWLLTIAAISGYGQQDTVTFTVGLHEGAAHRFRIGMEARLPAGQRFVDFRMPVWSPGYYQLMDYADNVSDFAARDAAGEALAWERLASDTWRVFPGRAQEIKLAYRVLADRPFVATAYIDSNRGFIKPAALFMYRDGELGLPAKMVLDAPDSWPDVATALEELSGRDRVYVAPDFDTLYDSPLLVGKLRALPAFEVDGIAHRFIGYGMAAFDERRMMDDIRKIVQAAKELMGELPYRHYTFIGLGAGQGGIEQGNSTAISFTGQEMDGPGRLGTLSFIAHEYFHLFNVKRIRPRELGPFDYSQPNRTNLLWVAEGLTVYYENVLLRRAGLMTARQLLDDWAGWMTNLENNPGRFKQTLAEASWQTWEDGPFGKPGETISYYVKGPIIGMLLDIELRHLTQQKRSLDDVMRTLYERYEKAQRRGFSEAEVRTVCEELAGQSLEHIFKYIDTTEPIDYSMHLEKAGLTLRFAEGTDGRRRAELAIQEPLSPRQRALLEGLSGYHEWITHK